MSGGRVWLFGDDVDTDAMAPGAFMKFGIETIAAHCLEALRPEFAGAVRPGDIVVAGRNFGLGSSREQAPQALRHLGVAAVVATSFAGLFHRNALNVGLPVLVCAAAGSVADGAAARIDIAAGRLELPDEGRVLEGEPIPPFLVEMLGDGGLLPHLKRRLDRKETR